MNNSLYNKALLDLQSAKSLYEIGDYSGSISRLYFCAYKLLNSFINYNKTETILFEKLIREILKKDNGYIKKDFDNNFYIQNTITFTKLHCLRMSSDYFFQNINQDICKNYIEKIENFFNNLKTI